MHAETVYFISTSSYLTSMLFTPILQTTRCLDNQSLTSTKILQDDTASLAIVSDDVSKEESTDSV
jgi:hypothetical protein